MSSAKSPRVTLHIPKLQLQQALLQILDAKLATSEAALSKTQAASADWPELARNARLLGDRRAVEQARRACDAVRQISLQDQNAFGNGAVLVLREDKRTNFYFVILDAKTEATAIANGQRVLLSNGEPWSLFAPLSVGQKMELRGTQDRIEGECEVLAIY